MKIHVYKYFPGKFMKHFTVNPVPYPSWQYPTKLATNTFIGNQNQSKIIPPLNFYPARLHQLTDIVYLYILSDV